ncbi:MAG: hypothetical protein MZV63_33800 [Marinilabiliales bacterium]|nr:hypothetical protein [Marinilabiliales bacterium]
MKDVRETMKESMVSFCRRAVGGIKARASRTRRFHLLAPAGELVRQGRSEIALLICDYIIMMGV